MGTRAVIIALMGEVALNRIVEPDEPFTPQNPRQLVVSSLHVTPTELTAIETAFGNQDIIHWRGQPCVVLMKRQIDIDHAEYLIENLNNT